jgi:hypothetical protein
MERELWPELYRAVKHVGSLVRQKSVQYQPWVLALVYLWAALHDRPPSWACLARHWTTTRLSPPQLPSPSTLSRRVYRVSMGVFWRQLEEYLRQSDSWALLSFVDGKPLVVGNASKDHDARRGRAAGGFAKGYKLHCIQANRPLPEAWDVTPLNAAESVVAQNLMPQISAGGYLLADGCYDSGTLFDRAAERGYQLLVPCESPQAGRGHRRQSPARLRSIALFPTSFGQELLAQRIGIEQSFGQLTSFAGGLGPLPAWVRRRHRVRTWVWSKLLINAIRIRRLKHQPLAA